MRPNTPWTIGVCAVGGPDQPEPNPGHTAWLLVVTRGITPPASRDLVTVITDSLGVAA